jgi:hypothetical protein
VKLAEGLRNILDAAEGPPRSLTAAVPIQRREILRERTLVLSVASDLESDEELGPRGVALVEQLLTSGDSPFYAPAVHGALRDALTHARAALHLA